MRAEGEAWVDAEEAYLGIAVTDRDDGQDWLSETCWISDIALADRDPEEVRRVVAALEAQHRQGQRVARRTGKGARPSRASLPSPET